MLMDKLIRPGDTLRRLARRASKSRRQVNVNADVAEWQFSTQIKFQASTNEDQAKYRAMMMSQPEGLLDDVMSCCCGSLFYGSVGLSQSSWGNQQKTLAPVLFVFALVRVFIAFRCAFRSLVAFSRAQRRVQARKTRPHAGF